jgi:hypothetical protein
MTSYALQLGCGVDEMLYGLITLIYASEFRALP